MFLDNKEVSRICIKDNFHRGQAHFNINSNVTFIYGYIEINYGYIEINVKTGLAPVTFSISCINPSNQLFRA